jgi:chaperonin GroES
VRTTGSRSTRRPVLARLAGNIQWQNGKVLDYLEFRRLVSMAKKKTTAGDIEIQPLGDRVVIEREEAEQKTKGGIVLPDTAKDKPTRGKVISVGEGRLLDDGKRSKPQVKAGDRVLFSSYAGDAFKLGDQELLLMREEDILAILA